LAVFYSLLLPHLFLSLRSSLCYTEANRTTLQHLNRLSMSTP